MHVYRQPRSQGSLQPPGTGLRFLGFLFFIFLFFVERFFASGSEDCANTSYVFAIK